MKCARVHLQERAKSQVKRCLLPEKPRRYCQRRLVNPEHCEDPRWSDALQRFHCNSLINTEDYAKEGIDTSARNDNDLYLSVQNLKFQGDVLDLKRPRANFKYKSLNGNRKHRMFVKQVVDENYNYEEDRSSPLSNYFDDYVKYILSTDRSRASSSGKSSIFEINNKFTEKSKQVENKFGKDEKISPEIEAKRKSAPIKVVKYDADELHNNNATDKNVIVDAKVAYHNSGKRKSLTISRVPSPETVQVIRVDVVCNYSSSSNISDCQDKRQQSPDVTKLSDKEITKLNFKGSHFADKYLLTKTIKSVDENLSCGSKVTLLCKTFKLSNRNKVAGKKYKKVIHEDHV
ncbi:hypothetical protein evm_011276 [Chilo suppressalis]|nr:hypothetical protein evm_011276 [Chilo suppressalis]